MDTDKVCSSWFPVQYQDQKQNDAVTLNSKTSLDCVINMNLGSLGDETTIDIKQLERKG